MTDIELSWLAGLLEGEGNFQINKIHHGYQWRIAVSQCERNDDIIKHVERILKNNEIEHRTYSFPSKKFPQRTLYIYKKNDVKKILEKIKPFILSDVKKSLVSIMLKTIELGAFDADIEEMKTFKSRSYDEKRGGRDFSKLPKSEWQKIKDRINKGDYLQDIANDYKVTKQAIWYLKKYHLFKQM